VRLGDGIELAESFPFYCDLEVPLSEPWDLDFAEVTMAWTPSGGVRGQDLTSGTPRISERKDAGALLQ
jgi:hypothetical protein